MKGAAAKKMENGGPAERQAPTLRIVPKAAPAAEPEMASPNRRMRLESRFVLGFCEEDGVMHVVRASRRLLGGLATNHVSFMPPASTTGPPEGGWCESWRQRLSQTRLRGLTIAARPESVAFACRPADEQPAEDAEAAAAGNVSDQMTFAVKGRKLVLRAATRREEIEAYSPLLGMELHRRPSCEPAPSSAWRASLHYAPLSPRRGIHLRFLMGEGRGLAVLSSGETPLAWQVLKWSGAASGRTLFQAHRLLSVFAERRIGIGPIQHVSLQGHADIDEGWAGLESRLGQSVERVDGPPYDGGFTAFGAALAGLETNRETLDFARSLQKPPATWKLVPWGEASFIVGLAFSLAVVLNARVDRLENDLRRLRNQNTLVEWARGKNVADIRAERERLESTVPPLRAYLEPPARLSSFLADLPGLLPDHTRLQGVEVADGIWTKTPDKLRGRRYALIAASLPFSRPNEMERLLAGLRASETYHKTLPQMRLTTISSQGRDDVGETAFSVLCLPAGGPAGVDGEGGTAKEGAGGKSAKSGGE